MPPETIERLRKALPPLLTLPQYCKLKSCSRASAYQDLNNIPGIAVKDGGSLRFVTDAVLDEMARLPDWTPRGPHTKASTKDAITSHKTKRRRALPKTEPPKRQGDLPAWLRNPPVRVRPAEPLHDDD